MVGVLGGQEMLTVPNPDKALCLQHIAGHLGWRDWTVKWEVRRDKKMGLRDTRILDAMSPI